MLLLLWACQNVVDCAQDDTCPVATCRPVTARPLQQVAGVDCIDRSVPAEAVGCVTEDPCGDISFVARDPDGVLYSFASYCWPDDFEGVGPSDEFPSCE